eukprot:Rmarinus@m.15047
MRETQFNTRVNRVVEDMTLLKFAQQNRKTLCPCFQTDMADEAFLSKLATFYNTSQEGKMAEIETNKAARMAEIEARMAEFETKKAEAEALRAAHQGRGKCGEPGCTCLCPRGADLEICDCKHQHAAHLIATPVPAIRNVQLGEELQASAISSVSFGKFFDGILQDDVIEKDPLTLNIRLVETYLRENPGVLQHEDDHDFSDALSALFTKFNQDKKVVYTAFSHSVSCRREFENRSVVLKGRPDILILGEDCLDFDSWVPSVPNAIAAIEMKRASTDAKEHQSKVYAVLLWLQALYPFQGVIRIRGNRAILHRLEFLEDEGALRFHTHTFKQGRRGAIAFLLQHARAPGAKRNAPVNAGAVNLFPGGNGDDSRGGGRGGGRGGSGGSRGGGRGSGGRGRGGGRGGRTSLSPDIQRPSTPRSRAGSSRNAAMFDVQPCKPCPKEFLQKVLERDDLPEPLQQLRDVGVPDELIFAQGITELFREQGANLLNVV